MSSLLLDSILDSCQAVIFDMDGVIADTEPLKFQAYQFVFREEYGIELPIEDIAWRGMKEQSVIAYWFNKFQLVGDPQKLIEDKRAAYHSLLVQGKITAIPGIMAFIKYLRSLGKLRAVATSSSCQEAVMVLEALHIRDAFHQVITRDDVQRMKPDPEVYLAAASALGANPSNCIVFEDSQSGVGAAKAAGMFCVGVLTSFSRKSLGPVDQVINDFTDLAINF
ncbi:Phosphorylated carbohydrates phosphatase [Halomicronema hongdechloris C2206]|uniref:Phosphorylated carbohydrates phosphatase n=1 Tax=Halomicronema hongdechloris C2206 TaxID=1641165 RepID=A0A1Z3HK31_9CYAN|nr:HAD family phosphatase [Halomicronema hongdechloris]ASC70437.1 Phosphorylated carbohydrates phosphatase [Halomicronema hongdechloris C2206]